MSTPHAIRALAGTACIALARGPSARRIGRAYVKRAAGAYALVRPRPAREGTKALAADAIVKYASPATRRRGAPRTGETMRYYVRVEGHEYAVDVASDAAGSPSVSVGGRPVEVDVVAVGGQLSIRLEGRVLDVSVEGSGPTLGVIAAGQRAYVTVENEAQRGAGGTASKRAVAGSGLVASPMPGRVLKLLVAEGDDVEAGAPLVIVEAMKMENELRSPRAGRVSKVFVTPGATVESGAKLVQVT